MANELETKMIEYGHTHALATPERAGFLSPDEKSYLEEIMNIQGSVEITREVFEARGTQPDLKSRLLEIEQLAAGDVQFSTLMTEMFIATDRQTLFVLEGEYRPGVHQLDVYVGGIKQHIGYSYDEIDTKRFMMKEGVGQGTLVEVKYFKDVPAVTAELAGQVFSLQNEIGDARTTSLGVSFGTLKDRIDALDLQTGEVTYDSFVMNGTQTDFILTNGSFSPTGGNTEVYLAGLTLEPTVDFDLLSSTTIRLKKATTNGQRLVIKTQETIPPYVEAPRFEREYFTYTASTSGIQSVPVPKKYENGMQRIDVYRNGLYQRSGVHYQENTQQSIYMNTPLVQNDVIYFVIYSGAVVTDNDYAGQVKLFRNELEEARYDKNNVASPNLKARLFSLETALSSATTSAVGAVDSKVTTLTSRVTTAEGKVTTAEGKVATVEGTLGTLSTSVSGLQTTVNGHGTRLGVAEGKITASEGEITTIKSAATALAGRVSTAETTLGTLGTTVGSHTTSIGTINTTLGSHTTSISGLTTRIGTAETNTSGLTTRLTTAEGSIATVTPIAQSAQSAVNSLTPRVSTVETNLSSLTTRVTTAETSISSVEGRLTTAETNISKFGATLVASLPTASSSNRGQLRYVVESGEDVLYFSALVNGSYAWKPVTLT